MKPTTPPMKHALLPLGHEHLRTCFSDAVNEEIRIMAQQARASAAFGEGGTVPGPRLFELPSCEAFRRGLMDVGVSKGFSVDGINRFTAGITAQMHYAINFELHRRKVFWVDESLAWMLLNTNLDIEGRALETPFPCFALAFQDEATLSILRAHAAKTDAEETDGGETIRTLTVYVTRGERSADCVDLDLSFVSDVTKTFNLPYLVIRNLHIRPDDDLETILDSDVWDVEWSDAWRPQVGTPELKRLVKLVINAILYATSASEPWPLLASPAKLLASNVKGYGKKRQQRAATRAAELRRAHSDESVFFLPGKIPIARLRQLRAIEGSATGRELFARFMVRGHWRRPPTTWSNQRPRWIEPYWKGPEMATIIEREYRMMV